MLDSDDAPNGAPDYAKPDSPGVHMGFDNTVAVYHVAMPEDTFEQAATAVMALLRQAQDQFPDWPRTVYLDVVGHEGDALGFDPDFYELQQDFWFSAVAPFATAFETPITGGLVNPGRQRNDVPDEIRFGDDTRPHAGQVIGDH